MTAQASPVAAAQPVTVRRGTLALIRLVPPLLLVLLLYWPTLSQPYFWDDAVHHDFATTRSLVQIWTDVRGLSYYRPATFTLYKLLFSLSPPGSTLLSHLFILAVHTANCWLVGCLTRCLLARSDSRGTIWGLSMAEAAGLIASLLFASYPFAALPVAHFAAVMHPLVTLCTLAAADAGLMFARSQQRRWLAAASGFSLLAPFVHESGVMAGTVAAAVLVLQDCRLAWRRRKLPFLLPVLSALFLPVWLIVPKTPNTFDWIGWGGVLASTTFFLQGPTFPLQPLGRLFIDRLAQAETGVPLAIAGLPWWAVAAICLVAMAGLLLAGLALWRERRLPILGVALAWALLTALPSIAMLPFPYVSVSQRLLYYGGPAGALLWAAASTSLAGRGRGRLARSALAVALVVAVAAVPVLYIRREMALHELALRPLAELATIGRQHPAERHLVANAVNWVNYRQPWYPLGQEGVSVSAEYIDLDDLVRVNSGTQAEFEAATFPPIKIELEQHSYSTINEEIPWIWSDVVTAALTHDRVWITTYGDERIAIEEAGSMQSGADSPPAHYVASFEEKVYLVAGWLDVWEGTATATLEWKYLDAMPGATVFRQAFDCGGRLLGQGDGFALGRMLPFDQLPAGAQVRDVRAIPLAATSKDGCYKLAVGLYLVDGTRITARGPDGSILADGVVSFTE